MSTWDLDKWEIPWISTENEDASGIPGKKDLLMFIQKRGEVWTDTIGLSVSDYLSIRSELRSIFFSDPSTKYDDATIITNIEASQYLNNGLELGGNVTKGYFLYIEGTAEAILIRAHRWAGEVWAEYTGKFIEYLFNEGSGQKVANSVNTATSGIENFCPAFQNIPVKSFLTTLSGAAWTSEYSDDVPAVATGLGYKSSRVLLNSGATYTRVSSGATLDAGQYTLSLHVKSNTGTTQKLRLMVFGNGLSTTYSSDKTVLDWEIISFTVTFTTSGSLTLMGIHSDAAGDAADLLVFGSLMMAAGPSPISFAPNNFKLVLGRANDKAQDPSWSAYGISTAISKKVLYSYTDYPKVLTQMSAYFVVRKTATPDTAAFGCICVDSLTTTKQIFFGIYTNYLNAIFSTLTLSLPYHSLWDGNFHLVSFMYDGSYLYVSLDGAIYRSTLSSGLSINLIKLYLAMYNASSVWPGDISYSSFYSVAHTTAEIATIREYVADSLSPREISLNISPAILTEGDSITAGAYTTGGGYPGLAYADGFSISVVINNISVGASTVCGATPNPIQGRAAITDMFFAARKSGNNILSVLVGTNDLVSYSAAQIHAAIILYLQDRISATPNLKTIVCTIGPRTDAGLNIKRNALNTLLKDDATGAITVICDLAADATYGPDAAALNATLYPDGLHPAQGGQAAFAATWKATVESLLMID